MINQKPKGLLETDQLYLYHAKKGTTANVRAMGLCAKDKRLLVRAGAIGALDTQDGFTSHECYVRERELLIRKGILVRFQNGYTLTCDHWFRSPSAASCILRGDSSSGLLVWRRCFDNRPLRDFLK